MKILKASDGFSILQIITTLAVISIISAITVPAVLSWMLDIRLKGAANNLFLDMNNVKMSAIKENKSWAIVFDTANNRYFICDDWGADGSWTGTNDNTGTGDNNIVSRRCMDGSDPNDPTLPATCSQRKNHIVLGSGDATIRASIQSPVPAPTAIVSDFVSYTGDRVIFRPQGIATAGYVYIQSLDANTSYAIGTSATGVVRVFKSNKGESGYAR